MPFDAVAVRVLGALIEKEMTTPDYYPLSLNALVAACNQKSNRDPVLALDEGAVAAALEALQEQGLTRRIVGDGRVAKYAHRVYETLNLGNRETAVLCVLLLRGPQTPGELRSRAQSLYKFDDLAAVEACLERLGERPEPLVTPLARQPGSRETRWTQLLGGPVTAEARDREAVQAPDRVARLEAEVERLSGELEVLRQEFGEFRKQFD